MKVTEKKLGDGRIRLEAIAATAEVAQALAAGHHAFCQQMGVRPKPGQTLDQAAAEQLGVKDLDAVSRQQAVEYLVPFAIDKRNLTPAFPPKAVAEAPIERGKTFSFVLDVSLKPDYELTSYDPVEVTLAPFSFDESLVDRQISQIAENYASFEPADPHPVGENDCLVISLDARRGGEPVGNLSTEGRTYVMGMQLMPPDFEEQLLGMNVGESKSFSFAMPGAPEGEPKVDCTVSVKEMQKRVVSPVDDEWVAKNLPMYRDAQALRANVRETLEAQQRAQYEDMKCQAIAAELAKRFQGSIADEVYEAMRETMMTNLRGNLQAQGIPFEQFVESQGGEQQFGMIMMMQTREILVQGYSLDAVFRHEHMELSKEDIEAACRQINPQDPLAARRQMEGSGQGFALREMAERLKANVWLAQHAVVKEERPSA